MNNKELHDKVDQVKEDVSLIKQALLGFNGQPGLCEDHLNLKKRFERMRTILIIIGCLYAGASGVSIWKIISLLSIGG